MSRLPALLLCAVLAACGQDGATPQQTTEAIAARIDADDLPAADELIRIAVVKWPDDPRLRELQGDLDLKRGYGTRAQAAYEKALIRAPTSRVLTIKLARALMVQERYREALVLAQPQPGDEPEVRGRFSLVRLEAEVALGSTNFRAWREEAEALWRLAASPPPGSDMRVLRLRLQDAAQKWEAIEAGRQYAQCRPPQRPARSAESDVAIGELIRVGAAERLKSPAAAAAEAKDGAVIEIADGNYEGEAVTWSQNNLTLRGRNGRPHLRRTGASSSDSAIWVLRGERTLVENIQFAGAADGVSAGAAIRLEGGDLTVRGSIFRNNGSAIVATGKAAKSQILITGSEFGGAATDDPDSGSGANSIDIGPVGKLTLEFSYLHGAPIGPGVSSRARITRISYNRIADGSGGRSPTLVDLPEGGTVVIVGNELHKGPDGASGPFISFGAAAGTGAGRGNALYVLSNTFYNEAPGAVGVSIRIDAPALVANNVYAGAPMERFSGKATEAGNQSISGGLANRRAASFELTRDSPAIDAAVDPRTLDAGAPLVEFEYRHPTAGVARTDVWKADAGAHEFCGSGAEPAPGVDLGLPGA